MRVMFTCVWGAELCGLLIGILYCWGNTTGHSGFSPSWGSFAFIPFMLFGIYAIAWERTHGHTFLIGAHILFLGIAGVVFGGFIQRYGIMLHYLDWLERGHLPRDDEQARALLSLFGMVLCTVIIT